VAEGKRTRSFMTDKETIRAGEMHRAGFVFRRSANGVWLVDQVPPQFIEFP